MCPRTCRCPRCPPCHPSDGSKGPPRQPLSPHRPLVRSRRAESPRHPPGAPSPSPRAAAAVLPAFAGSGRLLTGLAGRRRSTFRPSPIHSRTPTSLPPRPPSPRRWAHSVGAHAGRLRRSVEAGSRTAAVLLRLFVVRFGWSLEVAELPRKPRSQRRQTSGFFVCKVLCAKD